MQDVELVDFVLLYDVHLREDEVVALRDDRVEGEGDLVDRDLVSVRELDVLAHLVEYFSRVSRV